MKQRSIEGMSRQEARKIAKECDPYTSIKGMYIHHIDGNPLNNHPDNLAALTPKEHRYTHVLMGGYKKYDYKKDKIKSTFDNLEAFVNLYNEGIYI